MNYSKENNKKNIKKNNSNNTRIKSKTGLMLSRIIIALVLIICFAIVGGLVGMYLAILRNAEPLPTANVVPNIYTSEIIVESTGEVYATLDAKENRIYATLDQVPDYLENAFIAIEDERFYQHSGVDIKGSLRSVYSTLIKGSNQGGSTITQQLIKNARGLVRNDFITKLQEQYLAITYEDDLANELGSKKAAKDYILELYLNTIAMGHNLNGVQTAANYYFDKDVSEVTLSEAVVLAAITQYPTKHAPDDYPDKNFIRANITLSYMLEQGYITDSEYVEAKNDLTDEHGVYARISESRKVVTEEGSSFNSYYTDQVITDVIADLVAIGYPRAEASNMVFNGGVKIHIPIDLTIQNILEETYLDDSFFPQHLFKIEVTYYISTKNKLTEETTHHERSGYVTSADQIDALIEGFKSEILGVNDIILAERYDPVVQPQSSFVVIEQETGKVRGIVGGRGPKTLDRSFNRATQSKRQPGSVFKILSVYAPGIDMGLFYPGYVIDDMPLKPDASGHSFSNWNFRFEGLMTVRRAIYNSVNVVAVNGLEQVGLESSMAYLQNFGITTMVTDRSLPRNDWNYSTALGGITDGVTNLEMTAAYATIANNGTYIEPQFYTVVYDHNGDVLLQNEPETRKVLSDDSAYLVTNMMQDVVTRGTGGRASLANISMPVSGKTGTTSDNKDFTFAGYTPYYTAGVILGYDSPEPINGLNNAHLTIWQHIMTEIHTAKALESTQFVKPSTIVYQNICLDSGVLANQYCSQDPRGSRVTSEIFSSSNVPTTYCTVHGTATIDTSTGRLANEYCPEESVATIVGLEKTRNYYNTYSYVQNYFTVVEDAIYELPVEYCTVHDIHSSLLIIDDEDEDENDDDINIDDGDLTNPNQNIPSGDGTNTTPPNNNNTNNNNNNNNNNGNNTNNNSNSGNNIPTVPIPEPVVPEEIPDFDEDNLIIP